MRLTNQEISEALDGIYDFFDSTAAMRKDVVKAALITEEVLLSFQNQFGEDHLVNVKTDIKLGSPQIVITLRGYGFDPTNDVSQSELGDIGILNRLLDIRGVSASYVYKKGVNAVYISVYVEKKQEKHFGGPMVYALLAGVVLGALVKLLPEAAFDFVLSIVTPVQSKLMGLITAVTVPMIFFSLLSSICALESINELNQNGKKIILRQFLLSAVIIVISSLVCLVFLRGGASSAVNFNKDELLSLLLSIFPTNLFTPFTEGNTLQLVVVALFAGTCIILLENKGENIKEAVADANQLFNTMMRYISYIIPVMIFFTLFKTIATSSVTQLAATWRLVAVVYVSWLLIILAMLGYVCVKWKVSPVKLLKCFGPSIVIAFSALSCTAAGPKLYEIAEKNMRINKKLFEFWYPLSTAFLSTSSGVTLVCVAFFGAYYNGVAISPAWLIICALLSFQLSITSPRVAGGIFASYTLILAQLGIPGDVIGLVIAANFLWANACTGLGMLVKCIDIVDLSFRENAMKEKDIDKYLRKEKEAVS